MSKQMGRNMGLIGLGIIFIAGCSGASVQRSDRPWIATTLPVVGGIVKELVTHSSQCDIDVQVVGSFSSGGHRVELKPSDVAMLRGAKMIVLVGAQLDSNLISALGGKGIYRVDQMVTLLPAGKHDHNHGHHEAGHHDASTHRVLQDSHFWLDPTRVSALLPKLAAVVGRVFGSRCANDLLMAGVRNYEKRLRQLNAWVAQKLKGIDQKTAVATHDAFQYFVSYLKHLKINVAYEVSEMHFAGSKRLTHLYQRLLSKKGAESGSQPIVVWDVPPFDFCLDLERKNVYVCHRLDVTGSVVAMGTGGIPNYVDFFKSFVSAVAIRPDGKAL